MNIYVGNLAFNVSEDELRDTFEAFGAVESVKIIKDRMTGESRGFGFVEMQVSLEGETAIREMDGKEFKGRKLVVNEARPALKTAVVAVVDVAAVADSAVDAAAAAAVETVTETVVVAAATVGSKK